MAFKLRSVLRGHESDVRSVAAAVFPDGAALTASRDQTCRLWIPSDVGQEFTEGHIFSGHNRYLACVCTMPPSEKYPHGLVVTSGHDNMILVFTLESLEPIHKLEGHTGAVCTLASGKFGTLLSGSWDKTARVWVGEKCVMQLKDHEAAVWAVETLPELGLMLTASADKTIKVWKAGQCERTLKGHTDCVRGLAVLAVDEFLSCANDCTIRRWNVTGDCLQVYEGHTNYVYSICIIPTEPGAFVTSGEDRTVRIWKDNECQQTITMPCQSIWSVGCLANGDIIAGSSDGLARIFTYSEERVAPPDVIKEFEEEVANQAIPAAANLDLGEIKTEQLPGPEALLRPGERNEQTKLIRKGGVVEAHQWDGREGRWKKVGEVTGAAGGEGNTKTIGKKSYEGKDYDYVFDVDIEEGKPPLQLPFNVTDDPYTAAHNFLQKNDLSPQFLDQVANFIIKNTEGVRIGTAQPSASDPFTGGSRYVPGATSSRQQPSGYSDPFTGGHRYQPVGEQKLQSSGTSTSSYFPQTSFVGFDTGKASAIIGKVTEFNTQLDERLQLNIEEVKVLSETLENVCSGGTGEENINESLIYTIDKLLQWPVEKIFPSLDILRLLIRINKMNNYFCNEDKIASSLQKLLNISRPEHPSANSMLVQRIFCNCFYHSSGRNMLMREKDKVLEHANLSYNLNSKNTKIAVASTFLNYSVEFRNHNNFEDKVPFITTICNLLLIGADPEARFRLLVALGTLISDDSNAKSLVQSLGVNQVIGELARSNEAQKVVGCAGKLVLFINS